MNFNEMFKKVVTDENTKSQKKPALHFISLHNVFMW